MTGLQISTLYARGPTSISAAWNHTTSCWLLLLCMLLCTLLCLQLLPLLRMLLLGMLLLLHMLRGLQGALYMMLL